MVHLGGVAEMGPVAPPVKAKYQRTAKGRKSQKANLMLAAVAEDVVAPGVGPPGPLMMPQRNNFGPPMGGSNYGQMGGGGFMENGGGFQHQFYGHIHEGSPHSFYGGGEGVGQQQQHLMGGNSLRVLPSFDQDFLRGPHQQQQQRPFYTTAGGGMVAAGGGMKQHPMEPHEQDYDALHRHHLSPPSTAPSVGGGGVKRDCHGDANNNCDFSEMRMFNGIKSEFPGEDHSSSGGGGGRLSSPMTNTNATTPDDVLEEL